MSAPDTAAEVARYRRLAQEEIRTSVLAPGRRRTDKLLKLHSELMDIEEALDGRGLRPLRDALETERATARAIVMNLTGVPGVFEHDHEYLDQRMRQYPQYRGAVDAAAAAAGGVR